MNLYDFQHNKKSVLTESESDIEVVYEHAYNEFEFDDEDEPDTSGLYSGCYVRDRDDSRGEIFKMVGDPQERRVQIVDRNGSGWNIAPHRLVAVDSNDPKIASYFNEQVTEDDPEVIDEVAMNPRAFAQAIKQGQDKGVLVGFEFETCIPKSSIETWKNGGVSTETAIYDPNNLSWIEGKTVGDLIAGLDRTGRKNWQERLNDLFKYKTSVKAETGFKSPWYQYSNWVSQKIAEVRNSTDATQIVFDALKAFLTDPEIAQMRLDYISHSATATYGDPAQYNGKTFALAVLKNETGVDFSKRVPKSAFTPELAGKIRDACRKIYQWTSGPLDQRASQVANALNAHVENIENQYMPGNNYRMNVAPENIEQFKQHFADFCREKMGTDNLKDLLKTKWAFNGRTNNNTETLKEKLWYFVTPGAPEPASLQTRSYNNNSYMDGAEFLKANLKDVYGNNMVIFRGYHQDTKKLDRWYIEPDGSLRPKVNDYSAEVVSPPLPAADAMAALKTWYSKAQQLKLYTNNSTGLHINVSIPETLDVLKLAVFAGDQYVLKQFGREDNSYARSVIKSLKGQGSLPTASSAEFKDAEKEMKEMVKRISGDHFATVNFNGKYVSFRHAGGDYLSKGQDIANTVGRFVRAMIVAADPAAHRDEYVKKLVKLMKTPANTDGDKLPLSDIRQIASNGIPTVNLDVVVIPQSYDDPAQNDIDRASVAIKSWASGDWRIEPRIVPDPSARARLLASRGFASTTKQWIERAPDNMFYRVTIAPTNRRELESLGERYAAFGNERGAAIGLHNNGKRAVGVRYYELIKQDNPAFASTMTALRGGSPKPLPLPGSRNAPAAPAQQPTGNQPTYIGDRNGRKQYEIFRMHDGEAVTMPDSSALIIRADDSIDAGHFADQWLRANVPSASPRTYNVRPVENAQQPSERQFGIWNIRDNHWVENGYGRVEYANPYAVREYMNAHNLTSDNFEMLPITQDDDNADDDGSTTYRFHDMGTGELLATEQYASNGEAFENAQELANNENVNVEVRHGAEDTPLRRFTPSDEERYTATGSYDLVTQLGDRIAGYVGSLNDAMNAAQFYANQERQTVFVLLNGERLGGRTPDVRQSSNSDEASYAVVSISGRVMARGDSLRDIRIAAQGWADRENTTMVIRGTDDDRLIDTIQPHSNDQVNESRIYHASGKVNVIYSPHNSRKEIIVARAVDHALANRVINTYVHRTNSDPTRQPMSDKDFVLQPITNEDQYGGGAAPVTDTTSPIHGNEADYGDKYQSMVQRVGQKAREQERKNPVDLRKLAQRLQRQDEEMETGNKQSAATRELMRVARQSQPDATSDTDAMYGYLGNMAKQTQDNYKQVNAILRQLDPLNTELSNAEQELQDVEQVNQQQQDLLRKLSARVNQVQTQTLPSQQRAANAPAQQAANNAAKERDVIATQLNTPQPAAPADSKKYATRDEVDRLGSRLTALDTRTNARTMANKMLGAQGSKASPATLAAAGEVAANTPAFPKDKLAAIKQGIAKDRAVSEEEIYESRLYAMKKSGYDIL